MQIEDLLEKYDGFVFDLDGTLVDSMPLPRLTDIRNQARPRREGRRGRPGLTVCRE